MNLLRRAILSLPSCAVVSAHAGRSRGEISAVLDAFHCAAANAKFDELLDNAELGRCRGTDVLRRVGRAWKIEQYHLRIPVPNGLADEVVKRIRAAR